MKIAIMQPYFLPYIGYFQLINAVDKFIVYDNIQYTKKGWINRNQYLLNDKAKLFTIPIKKDSDFLDVRNRFLSENWKNERIKLFAKINEAYRKAPFYKLNISIVEEIFFKDEVNLFNFILYSIRRICEILSIKTQLIVSSDIFIDESLKKQEKVIALCNSLNAEEYFNPIGGVELYDKSEFIRQGIKLNFIKTKEIRYDQQINHFIPNLSIIDLLMFNDIERIKSWLNKYEIQ